MPTPPAVLCIAGFDPSAGAGIVADAKTCAALGVYAATAITALTVQSTRGVREVDPVDPAFLGRQIEALLEDLPIRAIKIGMLCAPEAARVVAQALAARPELPAVLDPVAAASSGASFWQRGLREVLLAELLPRCALVTPNLPEAAILLGTGADAVARAPLSAAQELLALGARAVLLKGGHGTGPEAVDLLVSPCGVLELRSPRISTRNDHGTGCTLSSAIASELARGAALDEAVRRAKRFLDAALRGAVAWDLGRGRGPLAHFDAQRGGS
jgi:hydroxymethylpyrimidine/phosphomethylpyrimidine kinase